jgi:hypothetical protein
MEDNKKSAEKCQKRRCEICDFECSKLSNWLRHIETDKHKKNNNDILLDSQKVPKVPDVPKNDEKCYTCICGKAYKYKPGLYKHKKICAQSSVKNEVLTNSNNEENYKMLFASFMTFMSEQSELNKQIADALKNGIVSNCNNNTTTHINSHNKSFNLNFFLNETCKDAMNITDFVNSIELDLSDLEKVSKLGYIEGISNIIISNLKALDIKKRPIHCTDQKRETLYVKDNDMWEKENENNEKIRKAVVCISRKNELLLDVFRKKYPDCGQGNSKHSDTYNKMIIEALGGSGNNYAEKENKIIKNIARVIHIDKMC